jgi:hypothetical protein
MSVLLTNKFSHLNAKLFKDSFANTSENKYVFLAKIDPYGAGDLDATPDTTTLTPTNKRSEEITLHNDIIALKKILPADVTFTTKYHEWTTGTVYNQYSDLVDLSTYTNQQEGDADNPYFVVTGAGTSSTSTPGTKYVYKCLDNNSGGTSTVHPTTSTAGTQPARLTDGYVWKYMYSIIQTDWDNWYGTDNRWVPIQTLTTSDSTDQWDIQKNAVDGSVNHISGIANLTTSDHDRDVTLTGDGTGFTGTVNYVSAVNRYISVTDAGSGYTNVTAVNVDDSGGTPIVNGDLSAVLSPRGGHGWDAVTELSGHYVMVLVEFVNNEELNGSIYINNDYRKVGIISVPNVKTTSLGVAGSSDAIDTGTNALVLGERADAMVKDQRIALKYSSISPGDFTVTELADDRAKDVTVTQVQGATSATGKIVHVDTSTEKIYIIPDYSTTIFNNSGALDATIKDSTDVAVNVQITLDSGTALVDYDIIRDTGDIIYIDHLDPEDDPGPYYPVRANNQTDKIDLVIEF